MFDIPTALTQRESLLLSHLAKGKRVYEAGALLGYSTCVLAEVAKYVVSVDPHDGYPRNDPAPTWNPYLHNLSRYGMRDKVMPVQGFFQNVPLGRSDLAWADLTGNGALMEEWLRFTHGVPVVVIHDYMRNSCGGSTAAIDAYIRRNPLIKVSVVDTAIVLDKRK